jgi:meiotically up-regulated gene 157 (Mug157) protein
LNFLRDRLLSRYDASTGLYSTLQDAQDEYEKVPFVTYDNVLVWKAFLDMSTLFDNLHDPADAQAMTSRAAALRKAIMTYCVASGAPGADGPIFVSATDGKKQHVFVDIPPGSLMKLPILGFISQDNPLFVRTYNWLHSKNYNYSYAGDPYGLPGSYRLPFTTSWSVADHLQLKRGHDEAMKILLASHWDGGIITEGIDPNTASAHKAGRAFATAAGYVASAICTVACEKQTQ